MSPHLHRPTKGPSPAGRLSPVRSIYTPCLDPVSFTEEPLPRGCHLIPHFDPSRQTSWALLMDISAEWKEAESRSCKQLNQVTVRPILHLHLWLTIPRQKDGIVKEVLEDFQKDAVTLLPVLLLRGLLADTAWALLCPCQVWLGWLCALFHVCKPCCWDPDRDL